MKDVYSISNGVVDGTSCFNKHLDGQVSHNLKSKAPVKNDGFVKSKSSCFCKPKYLPSTQQSHEVVKQNDVLSKNVMNELSHKIVFDEDVLKDRSISKYVQKNCFENIFSDKCKIKSKKPKQCFLEKVYPKRHMPCHLTPIDADEFKKNKLKKCHSEETMLLGVSPSFEKLKTLQLKESSTSLNPSVPSNQLNTLKPNHTWDEHVLALLSNSTADIILNNFTPNNHYQEKLKKFLNDRTSDQPKTSLNIEDGKNLVSTPLRSAVAPSESIEKDAFFTKVEVNNNKLQHVSLKNVCQISYPQPPNLWCKKKSQQQVVDKGTTGRWKRGLRKWVDYPQKIENDELQLQQISTKSLTSDQSLSIQTSKEEQPEDCNLLFAVEEWRTKWLLEKKWFDKTLFELKDSMCDINDHVRLAAVTAASKSILKHRKANPNDEQSEIHLLTEVKRLLLDECTFVSLAAAITLFSVDRADSKAKSVLMEGVRYGAPSERWIAVQCLGEYNHHDDCILKELISHVDSSNPVKGAKACALLKQLSVFSSSIQYMLAEQLNSASWRDRVSACEILPLLHGDLNKDIANKLSYLMWNDWSKVVRKTAAKCLGLTRNGKLVHNALCERLSHTNHLVQIDALKKISHLGIATPQILAPFLVCLQSSKDTMCLEAIKTASVIKMHDERVITALCGLVSDHTNCKVKAHAVQALGRIGDTSEPVRTCLLWAVHYEKEACVRIEACNSMSKLRLTDDEIVRVLQDMIIVEENQCVKSQVAITLYNMGLQPTGDVTMLKTVQENVKKLCCKERILTHILSRESLEKLTTQDLSIMPSELSEGVPCSDDSALSMQCESIENPGRSLAKGFNPIVEAYHARLEMKQFVELPQMTSSYIPHWSESLESLKDGD